MKRKMQNLHPDTRGSTLIGILIGLLLGLGIALGVAFFVNKQKTPYVDRVNHPIEGIERPAEKSAATKPQETAQTSVPSPAVTNAAGDKRFEAHSILAGGKEAVPKTEKNQLNQHVSVTPAPAVIPDTPAVTTVADAPGTKYYLQVGAFTSVTDADNLKAKIALIGMQADVKAATVQDKGVMHRVRLGPYKSSDEMTQVRDSLTQNGIASTVIPIKPKT